MGVNPDLLVLREVSELGEAEAFDPGDFLFAGTDGILKRMPSENFYPLLKNVRPISPSDTGPFQQNTLYKPTSYSASPGTNYPNAGSLKAIKGYDTLFFYNGTSWTKMENELPGNTAKEVYVATDNVNPVTMMGGKNFFLPLSTTLAGTTWNLLTQGFNKTKTLTGNTTITPIVNDGETGFILITGNGFKLTIAGTEFQTTAKDWIIGVKRMGERIFAFGKEVANYIDPPLPPGISNLNFVGSELVNSNNVWTSSSTNNAFGHTGIDAGVLAAGAEGRIWMKYQSGDVNAILGFTTGSVAVGYSGMKVGFWKNDTNFGKCVDGAISGMGVPAPTIGRFYGIYRDGSGNLYFQESTDENNWNTLFTFGTTSTSALRAVLDIAGQTATGGAGQLSNPKRNY